MGVAKRDPVPTEEAQQNGKPLVRGANKVDEAIMLKRILVSLHEHEQRRIVEGFNEINFTVGVLNTMFVAYIFGNYPEHFWLLWLVEAFLLIPLKLYQDWNAKPLRQILYYLDYCWIMNFGTMLSLFAIIFGGEFIPNHVLKNIYMTVLGACCGPVLGATAILPFVAFVFHDNKLMTSLFIHLTPTMLVYTFAWHAEEIAEAYPSFVKLDGDLPFFPPQGPFFFPGQGLGTIGGNAVFAYFVWWTPYTIWMFTVGLDLTRKNRRKRGKDGKPLATSRYDTAFHSILRGGMCELIGRLWGRPKEESLRHVGQGEYERRDLVVFMLVHALASWFVTIFVAYGCCTNKRIHATMLWGLVIVTVHRGSYCYVEWVKSVSSHTLQEEFAEILKEVKQA